MNKKQDSSIHPLSKDPSDGAFLNQFVIDCSEYDCGFQYPKIIE